MSDRTIQIGIRISADGSVAVSEVGRVRASIESLAKTADRTESSLRESAAATEKFGQAAGSAARHAAELAGASEQVAAVATRAASAGNLLGAGVVVLTSAYLAGLRETQAYSTALTLTGNAAGATADQLSSLAARVAESSDATRGAAAAAVAGLTATGRVAADSIGAAAEAALRMGNITGKAVAQTVKEFDALGREPLRASLALNDGTNYLTEAIYRQIKGLEEQGRTAEAATVAQRAWADAQIERADEIESKLGALQKAWNWAGLAARGAWDAMLDIGRGIELDNVIDALERSLGDDATDADRSAIEARIRLLRAKAEAEKAGALAVAENAAIEQGRIRWWQEGNKYLSRQARMEQELYSAIEEGSQLKLSDAQITERYNAIIDRYSEKTRSAKDDQSELNAEISQGRLNRRLLAEEEKQTLEFWKSVGRENNAAFDSMFEAEEAARIATEKSTGSLRGKIEAMERETALMGMSTDGRERAVMMMALEAEKTHLTAEAYEQLRQRMEAALSASAARRASVEAATEFDKVWSRVTEDAGRSLSDEIMRGGKSGGELLQNFFKTLVLRPVIQGVVSTGMSGFTAAPSGLASTGNLLSGASSLWSAWSGGTTSLAGNAASLLGFSDFGAGLKLAGTGLGTEAGGAFALGESIGTALPYIGAAIAIASLLSGKGGGPKTEGALFGDVASYGAGALSNFIPGAVQSGDPSHYKYYTRDVADATVQPLVESLTTSIQQMAVRLGGDASNLMIGLGFNSDPQGTAQDSVKGGVYTDAGQQLYFNAYQAARGSYSTEIGVEANRVFLAALKSVDLAPWANDMLDQLNPVTMSATALTAALEKLIAMDTLADAFDKLGLSTQGLSSLVDMAGSPDALAAAMTSYYGGFYSDSERADLAKSQLETQFSALGLSLPDTNAQFRDLVESLDLTAAAGQQTFIGLMSLAPAFLEASDAVDAVVQSVEEWQFKTRAEYIYGKATGTIPHYAAGGYHDGGWALVGENGPELANLGPARVYSHNDSRNLFDMSGVLNELAAIRRDLRDSHAAQVAMVSSLNVMAKKMRQWDGDGMPAVRVLA